MSNEEKTTGYSEIANTLLRDRFLLTALEFHTELLENGKELRQLKDFFSNPGNFEQQTQETLRLCKPTQFSETQLIYYLVFSSVWQPSDFRQLRFNTIFRRRSWSG